MRNDIARWIRSCLVCKKRKTTRPLLATPMGTICRAPYPFHTLCIDLVIAEGTDTSCVLTCLDLFSRYVILVPLAKKDAGTVADAIFSHIFCVHGRPNRIISDDGTEFINAGLQTLYERWNIEPVPTGGYQPNMVPVERFHRWLNSQMTMLIDAHHHDWVKFLPVIGFTYNSSACESTGFSPHFLIHGREPLLLESLPLCGDDDDLPTIGGHATDIIRRLKTAYTMVLTQQEKMAKRNQRNARNAKSRTPFEVGDTILYYEPSQEGNTDNPRKDKWRTYWSGPHVVKARHKSTSGFSYDIWHTNRAQILKKVHANRLVLFSPWSDDIPSTSAELDPPPAFLCSGDIPDGSLMVIPFLDKKGQPFGIAKKLGTRKNGYIDFQWWGNKSTRDTISKPFEPGWVYKTKRGKEVTYYGAKRRESDSPFTDYNFEFTAADVVLHSFQLTPKSCIPINILRAISSSPKYFYVLK